MKRNTHEHIGIELVDWQFQVKSAYDGNFRHILDHALEKFENNADYPFISTIDPYSDTLYNSLQTPYLVLELERLASEDEDSEFKVAVQELVTYLNTVSVHNYIRFLGE